MTSDQHLRAISVAQATETIQVYGIILLDLRGIIQSWNRGAEQLLGFSEAEAVGQHFEFFFTPEDRQAGVPKAEIENALSENDAYDDRWHLRRDQTRVYVNGGLCLIKNEQSQVLGFMKIVRDQTEKKARTEQIENLNSKLHEAHEALHGYAEQLEERVAQRTRQLNERNKELETFCYSIAHDLRAPLRSIQAMSQVVMEDYGKTLDATCVDYLNRISRAGARLDRLTLDLLKYSRLSREEIQLKSVCLEAVVEEIIGSLQENIAKCHAEVRVKSPLPKVHAQHAYVVQILGNFISNSLKFVAPGVRPVIDIWAETNEDRVRIFVQDNGIGIPDEYRERIFHLFERLHPNDAFEGTGVGLAIAHKAAARIDGTIGMLPPAAQGTTFWLSLELAK